MSYALKVAKTKILMTLPKSLDVALAAAKNVGIPTTRVFLLEGQVDGFRSIQDLMQVGARYDEQLDPWSIPEGMTNADVCGYLNFSSGTTGLPKAVSTTVFIIPCGWKSARWVANEKGSMT